MTKDINEKRAEPREIIDQYYSVEFSIKGAPFAFQFKLWTISSKGICVIVKENSTVMKHLKVGHILDIKYYKKDTSKQPEYLKTEIRHITKDDQGQFTGHYLVGLSILENQNADQ